MKGIIHVSELSKSYGQKRVLQEINLLVQAGEVFGLLGANGAGKSTTIDCILGAKTKDYGTVSIMDMDPMKDRKKLFEQVGVQFQEGSYQDRITVSELCEETACLYKNPLNYKELLTQFKLDTKLKSAVSVLSGGERQKLFVILALIPNPTVVFLDELTTGLDTKARKDVWKILSSLKEKGLTVFLTSHYMDEVEALCDRIAILRDGQIIFTGTVEEAVAHSPYDRFEDAYLWFTGEDESL